MTKFEEEIHKNGGECFEVVKNGKTFYEIQGLTNSPLKIFRNWQPQQALPVVPECVGEWIEYVKGKNNNALALLDDDNMPDDVNEWLFFQRNDDNINLILRAWLDGYTVEKPQLFKLIFPNSTAVLQKNGELNSFADTVYKRYLIENAMTEQEIKAIDERYWQFAVPVEDRE